MNISRKEFINVAAGAAAMAVAPVSMLASTGKPAVAPTFGKIKRAISVYSYSRLLNTEMTLEDCFADIHSNGCQGIEILASHVKGYPDPTEEWIDWFKSMMEKYELEPVQFGHWVDARLYPDWRTNPLSTKESVERYAKDIRLAARLGFSHMRTTIGITNVLMDPVENWEEFTEQVLPVAEAYNISLNHEIHKPTKVDDPPIFDLFINFIERTGTKNFGFNVDFGVFNQTPPETPPDLEAGEDPFRPSAPQDLEKILPYVHCCHAKFRNMSDDCQDLDIPYADVIDVLQKGGYEGFLNSEYEGPNRDDRVYTSDQLRKQHVMLKRLLGV